MGFIRFYEGVSQGFSNVVQGIRRALLRIYGNSMVFQLYSGISPILRKADS